MVPAPAAEIAQKLTGGTIATANRCQGQEPLEVDFRHGLRLLAVAERGGNDFEASEDESSEKSMVLCLQIDNQLSPGSADSGEGRY